MIFKDSPAAAGVFLAALALVFLAGPARALDGNPQGPKAKERHVYRDVQLGVSHPSPGGQSTQTSKPPEQIFPWLFPWATPSPTTSSSTVK